MAEIKRRNEERFKKLELSGFPSEEIEQMKFAEKYKLDYPANIYYQVVTDVVDEIFKYSDRIHKNVMYEIVKGLTEIDIDELFNRLNDNDDRMQYFSEMILYVVIKKMEILYYFYEDEVFSTLVFNLCNLLDLNPENYGFSMTA